MFKKLVGSYNDSGVADGNVIVFQKSAKTERARLMLFSISH